MDTQKEQWIEETMNSLDGLRFTRASEALRERLLVLAEEVKTIRPLVTRRTLWMTAASVVLIIMVNISTVISAQRKSLQSEELDSSYFSYMNQQL